MGLNNSYVIIVILVNLFAAQHVLASVPVQPTGQTISAPAEGASQGTQNGASIHYPSVKEVVDRLHQLDVDIGRLVFNSTSLFSPPAQQLTYTTDTTGVGSKSGDSTTKFTEVLMDLDSLQDEVNVLIKNVTRTRQYNLLVRLRPLNTLLYRIRNNLYLMRNSLIALNTVTSLEKIANSVLDTTLTVFLKPDGSAPGGDEAEDNLLDAGANTLPPDALKPDANEEALIAEAEAAAANDQDLNRPLSDLDGDLGFGQGAGSSTTPPPPPSPTPSTTTTTTTTTSPVPVFEQPPRLRPAQEPLLTRPVRTRIQPPSRTQQQPPPSTTVTSTTTTTTTEAPPPSTTTTTTTASPVVVNLNNQSNRNTNNPRQSNSTRLQGTRIRPLSSRPGLLELATE